MSESCRLEPADGDRLRPAGPGLAMRAGTTRPGPERGPTNPLRNATDSLAQGPGPGLPESGRGMPACTQRRPASGESVPARLTETLTRTRCDAGGEPEEP